VYTLRRFDPKRYLIYSLTIGLGIGTAIILVLCTDITSARANIYSQENNSLKIYSLNEPIVQPLTSTFQVYVPIIISPPPVPRQLGTVNVLAGPYQCDNKKCYDIQIDCPDLLLPIDATLRIGEPAGLPSQGTILFATGWDGTWYWGWGGEAARILGELQAANYRTVELKWASNWWSGAQGKLEGHARLACRPATVARWVYDNLNEQSPKTAFCAAGNSNGASQLSYTMAQYGLADIFSAVELDGGPNWARLDQACFHDDPAYQSLWYDKTERQNTDMAFGYPQNDGGPCAIQDVNFRGQFEEASLAFGNWLYIYPKTMVWFLFGELDQTITKAHGLYFYNQLLKSGSPLVNMDVITDTDHIVSDTAQGANKIRDIFINECHLR
jgi:hypothetical protein